MFIDFCSLKCSSYRSVEAEINIAKRKKNEKRNELKLLLSLDEVALCFVSLTT